MLDEDLTRPIEIEFCTGSFSGVRTSTFKAVGGFDESYFMETTPLCPHSPYSSCLLYTSIGGVAGHLHKYFPAASDGYMGRLNYVQDVYGDTAACLLIRREDVYKRQAISPTVSCRIRPSTWWMKPAP